MSERKKRECCTISDLTRHQIMRRIKSKNRCCHLLNPLLPQFSVDKKSFTSILLCIFHVLAPPSSSPFNFQFPGSIPQPCPPPPAPPSSSPSHSTSPSNPPSLPSNFLHASGFNKIQILSILPTWKFQTSQLCISLNFSARTLIYLQPSQYYSTNFQIGFDSVD